MTHTQTVQVVVLAPTTILAGQLYSSFSARLESNAIAVDMVSRFRSPKELSDIKKCVLEEKNDMKNELKAEELYIQQASEKKTHKNLKMLNKIKMVSTIIMLHKHIIHFQLN